MKKTTKSVAVKKTAKELKVNARFSVESLMQRAIEKDASVEALEKIMVMRKELKAEFAREEYDKAISNFQMNCPEIKKTKSVPTRSGQIAYSYAPLESIVRQVKSLLAENGLSYSIETKTNGKVKSICHIRHIAGHSESSEMEVPLGTKTGVMSDSQVVAAASTFSKRYAFCNALGIMTGEEDNEENLKEANGNEVEEAKGKLNKCMNEKELLSTWNSLTKEQKANKEIIVKANEIKNNIADVKNNLQK